MAETGRLIDEMRPWVDVNSIRVLGIQYSRWVLLPLRLNSMAIGCCCDFLVQKVCVGFSRAALQQRGEGGSEPGRNPTRFANLAASEVLEAGER